MVRPAVQRAVVAQDQCLTLAQVGDQRGLLGRVQHHALVVVVADLRKRMAVCVIGSRPQASDETAIDAQLWVWMTQSTSGRAWCTALWIT